MDEFADRGGELEAVAAEAAGDDDVGVVGVGWIVVGVVWVADTAAYFCGRAFGRHKLAPQISPGKTWEGALGAALAVAAYWFGIVLLAPGIGGDAVNIGRGILELDD